MKRGARMKYGKMFIAFLLLTGCLLNLFGCAAAGSPETTAAPEFMSAATETTAPIYEPPHTGVPVSVQYIRTDGIAENEQYPGARVILGTEDLQAYYNAFRDQYDLERREDPGSDYTVGFLDACDKYDEAYFAENYLILVVLEEPSGSIRHEVEQVIVDFGGQDTEIYLKRLVPEAGTDDMAQWHLLVELQRRGVTEYSGKVQVYIDGKLSYDGDRIVPPELRCEFTEPPVGTLVTPEQAVSLTPVGYGWNYPQGDGIMVAVIADQAARPVTDGAAGPVAIGAEYATTVYQPVPGSNAYEPTNKLGYAVKLHWEEMPDSVICTCWPESVRQDADIPGEMIDYNPEGMFYAKEGGYIYEFAATWEEGKREYYGTANYYVYIAGGADHTHRIAATEQTVDDPFTGYCGNTQTTLYVDGKAYTFMGGHSVTLTDILLNLDYDPMKVCRCLPEYTVDTEFGAGYGIHLSEGYARCEKGQADLTREQIDAIREIINWAVETNCTYPVS